MFLSNNPDNSTLPLGTGPLTTTEEGSYLESYRAALDDAVLNENGTGAASDFERNFNALRDSLAASGKKDFAYLDLNRSAFLIDKINGNADDKLQLFQAEELEYFDNLEENLLQLNQQDPSIPTLNQLWEQTKTKMVDADKAIKQIGEKHGFSALVGEFAGSMQGYLAGATSDPVRAVSLMFGGVGKTFVKRIASEIGINTFVEGMEQFTTIDANRKLAGLEKGWEEKTKSALAAGAFSGIFRAGVIEAPKALSGAIRDRLNVDEILVDAFDKLNTDKQLEALSNMPQTPAVKSAADAIQKTDTANQLNQFSQTVEGRQAFMASVQRAAGNVATEPSVDEMKLGVSLEALTANMPKMPPISDDLFAESILKLETTQQIRLVELDVQINGLGTRQDEIGAKVTAIDKKIIELEQTPELRLAAEIDPNIQKDLDDISFKDREGLLKRKEKKLDVREDRAMEVLAQSEALRSQKIAKAENKKSSLLKEKNENARKLRSLRQKKTKAIQKAERKAIEAPKRADQKQIDEILENPNKPIPSILDVFGNPRALSDVMDPYSYRGRGVAQAAKDATEEIKLELEALSVRNDPVEQDGMVDFGDGPIPADTPIPVNVVEGEAVTITARELAEEMAEDQRLIEVLEACKV